MLGQTYYPGFVFFGDPFGPIDVVVSLIEPESLPAAGASDQLTNEFQEGADIQAAQVLAQLEAAKLFLPPKVFRRLKSRFQFLLEPDGD